MGRVHLLFILTLLTTPEFASARVYKNIQVGDFETSFHLSDYSGQSFLSLMKEVIFPALTKEAGHRWTDRHIYGVKRGQGVELRLTESVTTFHVRYKAFWEDDAERSGRSFAGVDTNPWNKVTEYVADASYKHYLKTLEMLFQDAEQIPLFYIALLKIIINSDASGVDKLSLYGQQVLADFVAVYVAEQYRHLISGKGQYLGPRHNWDDAHLQVTLLAAFHSGQSKGNKSMFYKGRFVKEVFHQQYKEVCPYKMSYNQIPKKHWRRPVNLTDYWQFNRSCERSGVNLTRGDFSRLGRRLTPRLIAKSAAINAKLFIQLFHKKWTSNYISTISRFFINNKAPRRFEDPELYVDMILLWLMESRVWADEISDELHGKN